MTGPHLVDCPTCGARPIRSGARVCEVCETSERYEAKLATVQAARDAAVTDATRVRELLNGWISAACARHELGVASYPVPETLRRRVDSLLDQVSQIPDLLRRLAKAEADRVAVVTQAREAERQLKIATQRSKETARRARRAAEGAVLMLERAGQKAAVGEVRRLLDGPTDAQAADTDPGLDARYREFLRRIEQENSLREELAALHAAAAHEAEIPLETRLARAQAALEAERAAHVETMRRVELRTWGQRLAERLSLASDVVTLERSIKACAPHEVALRMKLTGQLVAARAKAAEAESLATIPREEAQS